RVLRVDARVNAADARAGGRGDRRAREVDMKRSSTALAILAALAATGAQGTVHDKIFAGRFDIPADAPANANAAARFLTQATFGPTASDIAYVTAQGYSEWIDEQLAKPATLGEPTVEAVVTARTNDGQNVTHLQRLNRWYWQATYAPDQLRQR